MWGRIAALIVKEFRSLWKDPKVRGVLIVPPLIQVVIFAYAANFDVTNARLGIWDEDRTVHSRELVERFERSTAFAHALTITTAEEASAAIAAERVAAVLHLGPRFAADLAAGRTARVQLLIDGRHSNTALIVNGYAGRIVEAFARERVREAGVSGGVSLVTRAWFNPNLESQWYILPGLVVLLTFSMTMMVTALSVAREREIGTFDQLLVTPLRPMEILVGKTVPPVVIGFGEAHLMLAAAVFWFHVPFTGNLLLLYGGLLLFLVSGVGIGLALSSVSQTQQQAILGVFLYLAPAIILSGYATPIANMPEWCQALSTLTPIRYMLVVARGVFLEAMPLELAWPQLWPMALIGAVTMAFATWLFRSRLA